MGMSEQEEVPRLRVQVTEKLMQVFKVRGRLTIGRAPENDIQLLHLGVSRRHAEVSYEDGRLMVRDLGSRNGTFVNGDRITERELAPEDEIAIGQARLTIPKASPPPEVVLDLRKADLSDPVPAEVGLKSHILVIAPTTREGVEAANAIAERFVESCPLDEVPMQSLVYALKEATSNAERHGNKHQADKLIRLTLFRDNEEIVIAVEDEGPGFDFVRQLEKSSKGDAVEAARETYRQGKIGGLGIRLILKCVDRIEYQKEGSKLVLIKYVRPEAHH